MANARFLYTNFLWNSSVALSNSAGAWLSTRPLSFLFSPWRKKVARSVVGDTDVDIVIDLGSVKTFNSVFLVSPQIHAGGSVELQVNDINVWGAPAFSMTFPAIDEIRKLTGVYFTPQTSQWVRIRFRNPAAVLTYVELGTVVIGNYFEPQYTLTDDFQRTRHDPSRVVIAYDGERQSHRLTKYDSIDGFLEAQPVTDKDIFLQMFDAVGTDTPIIFAVDSADLAQSYYAYFPNEITVDYHQGSVDLWDIDLTLEEAR